MLRLFRYLSEVDAHALTPAIAQPPHEFESVQTMFDQVYGHEQKVTRSIHKLMHLATKENDYATMNFLQWYIAEQREEESLMRSILDKIKLIGGGPQSLYYIDKELAAVNAAALKLASSTGGSRVVSGLGLVACSFALVALLRHTAQKNASALWVLAGLIAVSVLFELIYPRMRRRKFRI